MAKVKDGFAVLGLSRFGYRTAVGLYAAGAQVIAVDADPAPVQKISSLVTRAVQADAMDLEVLEHVGAFEADCVVIGFRRAFEATVLLAHHVRTKTGVKRIVAQVDSEAKAEALRRLGVDMIVFPESDIADRIVRRLTLPDLVEQIPLAANAAILEVTPPASFIGRSLTELGIRARYGVYVIGIRRPNDGDAGDEVHVAPPPSTEFQDGDTMLLLGEHAALRRFQNEALNR